MLWPSPFGSPTRSRPRPSQPRGRECRSNSSRQVRGAFGDCSWNGVSRAPRIYISAGEPSGDAHAAAVVTALKRRVPAVTVEAFGGPELAAAGAVVLDRMERFSVVGFVEALWKVPAHLRLLGRVRAAFKAGRYDLAILVDYPGYHLRVAAEAAALGIPVLYYIAPQMWAWAPGRVRKLTAVRRLAVILPFEEAFFRDHGVAATFVGHPLKDRPAPPPRAEARRMLGLDSQRPVLGLFPGSRALEVKRLWPAFRDAATRVRQARPDAQVVAAGTPHAHYPDAGAIHLQVGDDDAGSRARRRSHGHRLPAQPGFLRHRHPDAAGPPRRPGEPDRRARRECRAAAGRGDSRCVGRRRASAARPRECRRPAPAGRARPRAAALR